MGVDIQSLTEPAHWSLERERHIIKRTLGGVIVSVELDGCGKFIKVVGVKNAATNFGVDFGKYYR